MWTRTKWLIAATCLIAFALRLGPLFDNRFHPDEALYSTWALKIARGENALLIGVPVDKPSLLIYLSALSFFVFGQSELAGRVPNLLASVISVAVLYQVGRFGRRQLAASDNLPPLLLALSPIAILFAPTAFLDPTMIMFGLVALAAATRGRPAWAGVWLGLSLATKLQGVFFAPLVIVFARHRSRQEFLRMLAGAALIGLAVLAWDRARGGVPFWQQQAINYGEVHISAADEAGLRLAGWLAFLPYFLGPIAGAASVLGIAAFIVAYGRSGFRDSSARVDLALLGWLLGGFAFHWLIDFPIWDRYMLPLVPIAALLAGRGLALLITPVRRLGAVCWLLVATSVLPFSLAAAQSQYPIGGDHGANDGIDLVAAYLKTLPSGTVVYEHGQAWALGFYLGEGFAYLSYFDTPAVLIDELRVFGGEGRYIILSADESLDRVVDAVGDVGYTLAPAFVTYNRFGRVSFTVFKIQAG